MKLVEKQSPLWQVTTRTAVDWISEGLVYAE
jgi:hypothetical protein